jgi:hypothetical protein
LSPVWYVPESGVATTSVPEDTCVIVLISVVDMRTESPTTKIVESATEREVLPVEASAERVVRAVCT